jgi:hypothetical protein
MPHVWTFECFFRTTDVSAGPTIMGAREYNGTQMLRLYITTDNRLAVVMADVNNNETTAYLAVNILINTDYHLAVTYDPYGEQPIMQAYINGVAQTPVVIGITREHMIRTPYWTAYGCNTYSTGPTRNAWLQGDMAEVAWYAHVLPAARIQAHYDARNV